MPLLRIPFGDAVIVAGLEIPALRPRTLRIVWHIGAPAETAPPDRVVKGPPYATTPTGKVDLIMDLMADKKVALSIGFTDEVGNPVPAPDGAATAYTVDDPTVINLTDNGDGSASAAAVGVLGTANVHSESTWTDAEGDHSVTGDLQIVVVAGLAERATIVPGAVEEVTPDA
ncbi:MAG: hypothetical protein ACM30G_20085 [Micromonosporaceae bacterium]